MHTVIIWYPCVAKKNNNCKFQLIYVESGGNNVSSVSVQSFWICHDSSQLLFLSSVLFSCHFTSWHSHLPCNHLISLHTSSHLHLIPSPATHFILDHLVQNQCSSARSCSVLCLYFTSIAAFVFLYSPKWRITMLLWVLQSDRPIKITQYTDCIDKFLIYVGYKVQWFFFRGQCILIHTDIFNTCKYTMDTSISNLHPNFKVYLWGEKCK